MKKVFITGSNGFLGKEVVKILKSQYQVIGFDVQSQDQSAMSIDYVSGNMLDKSSFDKSLNNVDAIIHLAGIMQPQVRAKIAKYEDNIIGTRNLIEVCQNKGIKRFIFVSTNAVNYAHDGYAKSKLESEKIVRQSGLDYTIIRPTMIYGQASHDFQKIKQMIVNWPWLFTVGETGKFQPISVYDVALVIKKCLESNLSVGQTYSVGGKDSFTLKSFYLSLQRYCRVSKKIFILPVQVIKTLAFVVEKIFPWIDFNQDRVTSWASDITVDNSKAQSDLNWSPLGFYDGLKY